MNRRGFLKKAGISGAALSGIVAGSSSVHSFSDSVEIRLFQEESVSRYLEQNGLSKDFWLYSLENMLPRTLSRAFPDLEFQISIGNLEIGMDDIDYSNVNAANKLKHTVKWHKKASGSEEIDTVTHANVLLRLPPQDELKGNDLYSGFGYSGIMPSCCRIYEGYSSVWINPVDNINIGDIQEAVVHEVGHNLGLMHFHGCNMDHPITGESGRSIMLTEEYAEDNKKNVFNQKVQNEGNQLTVFNPKVNSDHLRI